MANTYKDKPFKLRPKVAKYHRGCNVGSKSCGYCAQRLVVQSMRLEVKAHTDEEFSRVKIGRFIPFK